MVRQKSTSPILQKYPITIPIGSHDKYRAYTQAKREFERKYGYVDSSEYEEWIKALAGVLGL